MAAVSFTGIVKDEPISRILRYTLLIVEALVAKSTIWADQRLDPQCLNVSGLS